MQIKQTTYDQAKAALQALDPATRQMVMGMVSRTPTDLLKPMAIAFTYELGRRERGDDGDS